MNWLIPTILAMLLFGLWGVIIKYSTGKIDAVSLSFFNTFSSLVIIAVIFAYFWFSKPQISFTQEGIYISIIAGAVAIFAVLLEATAYRVGSISIIGPFIAVGVAAFTALAGFFIFKEEITPRIVLGLLFALISIYLLYSSAS